MSEERKSVEALVEKLKELLESAREPPREIMNAKEAADFLRLSEAHFRKIAPAAPRHKIPGLGFRYIRSELTASSGDNGYGVSYPASSQYITAVGGTSLSRDGTTDPSNRSSNDPSNANWHEKMWSGAGSGCSAYSEQPSWQKNLGLSGCSKRMVADVAAIADPNTGVWVYDSYKTGGSHWLAFGGTSVASPIIASVYALAGNASSVNYGSFPYSNTSSLYDILSGTNGSCGGSYLCSGSKGYDGPSGLGTPNTAAGF